MVPDAINDDIFPEHDGPSIISKSIYHLFFSFPKIDLIGLNNEESAVRTRIIKNVFWNKSDRSKFFLLMTVCSTGTLTIILAGILLSGTEKAMESSMGVPKSWAPFWNAYWLSAPLLAGGFVTLDQFFINTLDISWAPDRHDKRSSFLESAIGSIIKLFILFRVMFGSMVISTLLLIISIMFDLFLIGAVLSYVSIVIPISYTCGCLFPQTYLIQATDELEAWHQAFIRFEELAKRANLLAPSIGQDGVFELYRYNPRHADSLETALERLDQFESYLDSYDRLLASYSQAEDLAETDPESELLAVAERYVRPYESPEEAAKKADQISQIVEQYPAYKDQYSDLRRIAETAGLTEHFEYIFPTPEEMLYEIETEKWSKLIRQLTEWGSIYIKYITLSEKLRHGVAPKYEELTQIEGIDDSTQQALSEIGIESIQDFHESDIERIVNAKGINRELASGLKSRVRDSIYPIKIEDLEGVGPRTAAKLRMNDIGSVEKIAEASIDNLQSIEGIGPKKASNLCQLTEKLIGSTPPESHYTTLLNRYSPTTADIKESTSQISQLEAWVQEYERYFELRYKAHTSFKNDVAIAEHMESFDFDEAAPWNFEQIEQARNDLDTLEQAVACIERHQQLLSEIEERTSKAVDNKQSELVKHVSNYLQESTFKWVANPKNISERFDLIEKILNLGDQVESAQTKYSEYPYELLFDVLISEVEEGIKSRKKIERVAEIINYSTFILDYLDTVETDHPSIETDHWRSAVRTALQEQYPDHLIPIKRQIQRLKKSRWEREDLDDLDWKEFESIVAVLFEAHGFDTETTRGTMDLGVDVWAESEDERIAIQAKHYAAGNTVGRETLQKLTSTLAKGDADRAVVVTSSSFADTAVRYANDFGAGLELINGDDLLRELSELEIPPPA